MDGSGNLYGTTSMTGGNQPWGTVFELIKTGGRYKYKQLYEFTNGPDGATPLGGVVVDKEGNVYGTTSRGGDPTCMCGTVFEISQ
jgi:uncharacterized repeat protein (TIGR03803 family)